PTPEPDRQRDVSRQHVVAQLTAELHGPDVSQACSCGTVRCVPHGHGPFAVFNRTANPVLRMVLSSPLHPLVSRHLALITVTGRRSGRRHTFPVAYREEGN